MVAAVLLTTLWLSLIIGARYLLVAGVISTIATMWLGTIRERNDLPHTAPASAATAPAEASVTDAAV